MPQGDSRKPIDALDDLGFLDELEGWSVNDMARTVGRMIRGADQIAQCLANGAESMAETYSQERRATPVDIEKIAKALHSTAKAIESYSLIYAWATAQGKTGKQRANALEDLMPHLQIEEMQQLRTWMRRLEVLKA